MTIVWSYDFMLPEDIVESPFPEILKAHLAMIPCNLLEVNLLYPEG